MIRYWSYMYNLYPKPIVSFQWGWYAKSLDWTLESYYTERELKGRSDRELGVEPC